MELWAQSISASVSISCAVAWYWNCRVSQWTICDEMLCRLAAVTPFWQRAMRTFRSDMISKVSTIVAPEYIIKNKY